MGIVADVEGYVGQTGDDPQMYEPYLQRPSAAMNLIMRTAGDPNLFAPEVRCAVWSVDNDQPISGVASITRVIDETYGEANALSPFPAAAGKNDLKPAFASSVP